MLLGMSRKRDGQAGKVEVGRQGRLRWGTVDRCVLKSQHCCMQ